MSLGFQFVQGRPRLCQAFNLAMYQAIRDRCPRHDCCWQQSYSTLFNDLGICGDKSGEFFRIYYFDHEDIEDQLYWIFITLQIKIFYYVLCWILIIYGAQSLCIIILTTNTWKIKLLYHVFIIWKKRVFIPNVDKDHYLGQVS